MREAESQCPPAGSYRVMKQFLSAVFRAAAPAVLVLSFWGCSLLEGEREVEVRLPELPAGWESLGGDIGFILEYPGPDGEIRRRGIFAAGEDAGLALPPEGNVPVTARPVFLASPAPGLGMRPAGGIFPRDVSAAGELLLTWEEGFLAECLLEVYRNAGNAEWVNVERLAAGVRDKAPENPWVLDMRKIVRSLIYGRYYGGFIAPRTLYPPAGPIPGLPEDWLWGDPFFSAAGGFYSGFHRAIAPGGRTWLDLYADEKGWTAVFRPGDETFAGRW